MNDADEIKRLQDELDALKKDFNRQYQAIRQMQQRLDRLTGHPATAAGNRTHHFSLENFIGLRLIHIIGIIVLVIGISIGVKYAIDRDLVSEGMRIILAYTAGVILFVLSMRLRSQYTGFSAILFSGAMASIYFTTYAAHVYYNMFPFAIAFILMAMITVFASFEALRYNRQEIALLGLVGAYAIPFLISKNADRPELFFLYISVINCGVFYLVIKNGWKNVSMTAQGITWLLFLGWASTRMANENMVTGFGFMTWFFLFFSVLILSEKWKKAQRLHINGVYQIIMNNIALYLGALFVFGLNETINENHLAFTTLILSLLVAVQAVLVYRFFKEEGILFRMLYMLSLILYILFIAFNWDGFRVTLLWLLTAVIILLWGFKKGSVRERMTGVVLIGITLGKLLTIDILVFTPVQKIIAFIVIGVLLLMVSFSYQKFRQKIFDKNEK